MVTWLDMEDTDLGALKSMGVETTLLSSRGLLCWGGGGCGDNVGIVGSGGGGTLVGTAGDGAAEVGEPTDAIGTESTAVAEPPLPFPPPLPPLLPLLPQLSLSITREIKEVHKSWDFVFVGGVDNISSTGLICSEYQTDARFA